MANGFQIGNYAWIRIHRDSDIYCIARLASAAEIGCPRARKTDRQKSKSEKWGTRVLWAVWGNSLSLLPKKTPTNGVIDTNEPKYALLSSTLNFSYFKKEKLVYENFLGSGVCLHLRLILWKHSIIICPICLEPTTCPQQAVLSPGLCSVPSALWPVCGYLSILSHSVSSQSQALTVKWQHVHHACYCNISLGIICESNM